MGIRFEIDAARRVMLCELSGSLEIADILDALQGIGEDARIRAGFRQLFDFTHAELDLGEASGTDFVQATSTVARKNPQLFASKLALVAPQPHQFGLLRMYEMTNQDVDTEIQVFWSRAEAEAWLFQPDEPDLDES
ncbi:MAG: hypothetical protein QNK05_01460 [Myxococcota bacterium]|nr:hypothetical protein [Myxococcota bacterium]